MNSVQAIDFSAVAPAAGPALALIVILLVDAFAPRGAKLSRVHDLIALLGLVGAGGAVAWLVRTDDPAATLCSPDPLGCSYISSGLTWTLQGLVVGAAVVCLMLAVDSDVAADRTPHHVLFLTATAGALTLAGARDLATLVVALETASLPVIGLVALRRDARGAQAGVTLLFTAVASLGIMLSGVALLLLSTGSLHLNRIAFVLSSPELDHSVRAVAVLGTLLVVAGIGFKVSVVPFHWWTPDTYAGTSLPVAAFLGAVSKIAGVSAMVIFLTIGLPVLGDSSAPVLGALAVLTITVGNLVALRQRIAVRLLAWSTVAQAGWVLLPLAAVGASKPSAARDAAAASIGYLVAYVVAGLAAFGVVIVLARRHPDGEQHSLQAYRGLARTHPAAGIVLGFALLCLAGLPPGVIGLVAKVVALQPVVDAGMWPVAVLAALNVALGLIYYLRWAALLVQQPEGEPRSWKVTPAEVLALGAACLACVVLSAAPELAAGIVPDMIR
ncbi:MAG: NADH-quinone oxidoreductase subunit [Actinomycetota bacterium]|nr:NADH-quinone oxidoreductase subunit [Actinomycetota bacterium]